MRFEVDVDDGANLDTLHRARDAYNAVNAAVEGFVPAADAPTFVQRLMDKAVADVLLPFGPATLSEALNKITELQAENAKLVQATPLTVAPAV